MCEQLICTIMSGYQHWPEWNAKSVQITCTSMSA